MKLIINSALLIIAFAAMVQITVAAQVETHAGRVFIIDRTGYKWDVTEARGVGFKPEKFQYGIGKDAFNPLEDEDMKKENIRLSTKTRIIGVAVDGSAHAYSVARLRHHEIANTTIGDRPIAAGY